jgi:voltage-gated potassium channel
MTIRRRLYLTVTPNEKGGVFERIFEIVLVSIIILNILAIVLDSVKDIDQQYIDFFKTFEEFSVLFFTVEYIVRVYSIVENPKYSNPINGRVRYLASPLAIIDLLAFLPFYVGFFFVDLRFLRIFRLMVLFRMFKITRYLHALNIFKRVLKDRKEQLLLSFCFILFILIIISFVMFYTEREAQPDVFSSIPATMWWGIATLTTVGYGDMVPITTLGKIFGGLFAIAGVGLLALPVGILSSGFFSAIQNDSKKESIKCPHCGKEIVDGEQH